MNRITYEPDKQIGEGWRTYNTVMRERYGLTPKRTNIECPRKLVGKRCLHQTDKPCVCRMDNRWSQLLDHDNVWTKDGKTILTAEPYGIDGEVLVEWMAELPHGLKVSIEDGCWNNTPMIWVEPC